MAAYEYVAFDDAGKRTRGVISADSSRSARRELRMRQLTPVEVEQIRSDGGNTRFQWLRGLSSKDRALVTRQLAVLLQSGMQVDQALSAAGSDAKPKISRVLAAVRSDVVEGAPLAEALSGAPRAFPPLYRSVVSAGEISGHLDEVMERLAVYLENAHRMRSKVIGALIYPIILCVLAGLMVAGLMVVVVPKLVEQFDLLGSHLPPLTQFVVTVSEFMQAWWWAVLALLFIAVVAAQRMRRLPAFRAWSDAVALRLPFFGGINRTVEAARFARVFATLSGSGATVPESLKAARNAMNNQVFVGAVDEISQKVSDGGSFSSALRQAGVFPRMMVYMVASGESGRNLTGMMVRAAEFLEDDFETRTNTGLSLMEPLIIVVLGAIIGIIVLAIMLPIIQLNTLVV